MLAPALLSLLASAAASAAPAAAPAPPRHVLFVVVDDLGFSDLGYKQAMYNISGPLFPTPTIDALALGGVRLESYYVHALCSPSRGAFLSGRYAYTTGGNSEVIVNGVPDQLPTNIRTIASLAKLANASTAAFGKWDVGMTSWGCTPLCRGFDHGTHFYNAVNDYFTHKVGDGLDFRRDFAPDASVSGTYSTEVLAARASAFIADAAAGGAPASFSYLAFQAIHAPQQVPAAYIAGGCERIPEDQPVRRIACGQMRAVDAALARVVAAYQAAGVWQDTVVILSADNGGNTDTGGSNYPLRGMKATMYEGGVRAAAFVSGAGLAPAVRGTVSHELYSLVDWLPTIAHGIFGVDLAEAALPVHAYQPPPPPLDGLDVWASLSQGAPSPRNWALLYLDPFNCFTGHSAVPCHVPGQGAIRVGKYKLIHGHVGSYAGANNVSTQFCGARDGSTQPTIPPLNVSRATSPPFCPAGWVLPPGAPGPAVRAPPEEAARACAALPCLLPADSPLLAGGTFLFDVVGDMTEEHDLAAALPEVAAALLAQLQAINATNVPQAHSANDPASDPKNFAGVWTPWRGDADPAACDPNATRADIRSAFDGATFGAGGAVELAGWAWSPAAAAGGRAALNVSFYVNGARVGGQVADAPRPPAFMNKTGAPNVEHGFAWPVAPPALAANMSRGAQVVRVLIAPPDGSAPVESQGSPRCYVDGRASRCNPVD